VGTEPATTRGDGEKWKREKGLENFPPDQEKRNTREGKKKSDSGRYSNALGERGTGGEKKTRTREGKVPIVLTSTHAPKNCWGKKEKQNGGGVWCRKSAEITTKFLMSGGGIVRRGGRKSGGDPSEKNIQNETQPGERQRRKKKQKGGGNGKKE